MINTLLIAAGLVLEGGAVSNVVPGPGSSWMWGVSLAQHAAASAMLATGLCRCFPVEADGVGEPGGARGAGRPTGPSRGRLPLMLLLFNVALFIPLLGPLGIFAALLVSLFRRQERAAAPFASQALPEFVLSLREPEGNFNQTGIRARLAHASIPPAQRLRSLLALQGMPPRVSNPLLQRVLGDATDDIRLVAYGLLDSREKAINAQIHRQLVCLKTAEHKDLRLVCQRELAELHWELVYSGLAQGDLRSHALTQALFYAEGALELAPDEIGLRFLKGRILNELGRAEEAFRIFERALADGLPAARVLPYMAEIAYRRADYAAVRALLARIPLAQVVPPMEGVVDFWVPGQDKTGRRGEHSGTRRSVG